jgi:biotin carboxyl carrier protein
MKTIRSASLVVPLAVALALLPMAGSHAHGDEDHAHDQPKAAAPAAGPAAARPDSASPAGAASLEASARLPGGTLFVPKHVQRLLGLRTQPVALAPLSASVELNGRVVVEPGSGGRIQATQPGTVVPAGKAFPTLGQQVRKGELIAWLKPAASSLERGDRLAQQAELGAQVALAERRMARLEQLEGSVPAKEMESARVELQALRKRQAVLAASLDAPQPLVAPVDGVLSAVQVVAGEVVDAKALLFEVVDPTRLAVEAPAYDLALPAKAVSAEGRAGGTTLKLQPAGAGRLLREQALPMRFRVLEGAAALAVGQPVKVTVRTRGEAPGAALPMAAVARNGAGETIVWVHADPERFEPRRVRTEALGADSVAVREGLKAGERVVTAGAALLSQVR